MNGLATDRVVIIDDSPEETMALLRALGRLGIGAVCFSGEKHQLPQKPLRGIRVVFLDLRLTENQSLEAKQYVSRALDVLQRTVALNGELVGIVLWAKDAEDMAEVKQQIPKQLPGFAPIFFEAVEDKAGFVKRLHSAGLSKTVEKLLKENDAARLLWDWEQLVHDAATGTTKLLSELAAAGSNSDVLKLLAALAIASGGKKITDASTCITSLFESLNPIHYDNLRRAACNDIAAARHAERLLKAVNARARLGPKENAQLNRFLLTSSPLTGEGAWPGNVYVRKGWHSNMKQRFPLPQSGAKFLEFVAELYSIPKKRDPNQQAKLERIAGSAVPCLLEITPACDHFQGKTRVARLMGGILVGDPKAQLDTASRLFAREIEGVALKEPRFGLDGTYRIVLSARHLFSVTLEKLAKCSPAFRFRQDVVCDVRAWFGSHASRVGYTAMG